MNYDKAEAKAAKLFDTAARKLGRQIALYGETGEGDAMKLFGAINRLEDRLTSGRCGNYLRGTASAQARQDVPATLRSSLRSVEDAARAARQAARDAEIVRLNSELLEQRRSDWRNW